MLAPNTKQSLNLIVDRMATLGHIDWDPVAAQVDLHFMFSLANTDVEPAEEYWEWPSWYIFRLTEVGRIFISPHKEKIPPELSKDPTSEELMTFLLRTFENQGIYEWITFPGPETPPFVGNWSHGWNYQSQHHPVGPDLACVFKERGTPPYSSSSWTAGFWFQELQILTDEGSPEPLTVDAFISRYHSYASKLPY